MKVVEIKVGTRIMLPCARCGHKRSVIFGGIGQWEKQKSRICREYQIGDRVESESIRHTRSNMHGSLAEMNSMEEE